MTLESLGLFHATGSLLTHNDERRVFYSVGNKLFVGQFRFM